jgi:hypothetical protein
MWHRPISVVTLVAFPFVSYGAAHMLYLLCRTVDCVYDLKAHNAMTNDWDTNTMLLVGAGWPVTMFCVPFLLLAILIGATYRSVWSDS